MNKANELKSKPYIDDLDLETVTKDAKELWEKHKLKSGYEDDKYMYAFLYGCLQTNYETLYTHCKMKIKILSR